MKNLEGPEKLVTALTEDPKNINIMVAQRKDVSDFIKNRQFFH